MTTPTAQAPAARADNLSKIYGDGPTRVTALDQVCLEIGSRSFTAIMGPSGSGKSTLMHCMAGLDSADGGQAWIGGTEITALPERRLTRLRRRFPGADLVVFGHSHIPLDESAPGGPGAPGLRIFNPGSPTDRRRQPHGTLGLLQIQDGRLITAAIVPVT